MDFPNIELYCLTLYKSPKRKNMEECFKKLNLSCKFLEVKNTEQRKTSLSNFNNRNLSMTYGHLNIIKGFLENSYKKYAIICEDDIFIDNQFVEKVKKIEIDFKTLNLDVLLLGYMLPYKLSNNTKTLYRLKNIDTSQSFNYHKYPEFMSGTQMYMISREQANYLYRKYYSNYVNITLKSYLVDQIIIKEGNCALIYPPIAIEDNTQQDKYHQLCHKVHYDKLRFIS